MAKNKLRGAAYQSVKSMATEATGYTDTSAIWGKRLPEVLDMINDQLTLVKISPEIKRAQDLITELKRRIARQAIINSQTR